jgi:hypothetical protein
VDGAGRKVRGIVKAEGAEAKPFRESGAGEVKAAAGGRDHLVNQRRIGLRTRDHFFGRDIGFVAAGDDHRAAVVRAEVGEIGERLDEYGDACLIHR